MIYKPDKTAYKELIAKDAIDILCIYSAEIKKLFTAGDDIYCKSGRLNKTACMKVLGWSKGDTPKLDRLFTELQIKLGEEDERERTERK